jgi:hypothetical protein
VPRPNPTILSAALSFIALTGAPAIGLAQDEHDRPGPSLELGSDPEPSFYRVAITADPVGAFFGEWGLRVAWAPAAAHAIYVEPAYLHRFEMDGLSLEIGYHLHPLGDGLSGPFLGVGVSAGAMRPSAPDAILAASAEAGWRFIWKGIVLAISGGASVAYLFGEQSDAGTHVLPRVSVELGYSLM